MLRASAIVVGLLVAPALVPVAALAVPAAIAQPHPSGYAPPDPPRPDEPGGMRRPEQLVERPSGFWTSNRPARGGAYRFRMLGVGLAVMGLTAFFVVRFLRRTSAARQHP